MKFSRNKNIITIEVEPTDCLPGQDPEFVADAMISGMQVMAENAKAVGPMVDQVISDPVVGPQMEAKTNDLLERWEET